MVKFKPLNVKPAKDNGNYVFGNFDIGLYYLDTPRFLGEQLSSLALVGGQNVWTEKGALVPQYGYKILGELDEGDIVVAVTKDSASAANFFIITQSAGGISKIYLYTANQGLKQYKTDLGSVTDPIVAHDGKNLIIYNEGSGYLFGSYYQDATTLIHTSENVQYYDYTTYYEFIVRYEEGIYYWNGKEIVVSDTNDDYHMTIISVTQGIDNWIIKAKLDGEHVTLDGDTVDLGEATFVGVDLSYYPEDYDPALDPTDPDYVAPINIDPYLIEVAQNRLFIVDVSGRIYYSALGGVDYMAGGEKAFDQKNDAGFFEGFYRDSSKVLSIEDYMDGIIICKENGIYYLKLEYPTYTIQETGQSGEGVLSVGNMQVAIRKIANIGQQYAGDHVIVRESIIAYDSNTASIVNAASVNVFGSLVAGDTIIDSRTLNSYNSGITASKRFLTYNAQENVFTLYYGEDLSTGIVLKLNATLFPRQLDLPIEKFIGFNQGVVGVSPEGKIIQDFQNGTLIESIPAYADFEAIGVRDNRVISSSILEVTELNGVDYTVTTKNTGTSVQTIHPNLNIGLDNEILPPLLYSDKTYNIISDSYELTSRWADKKSHVTRVAAPMSGRDGVSISIEFPLNTTFCLAALRLPDFSQGEL